jgi:hypothetical protein
MRLIISIIYSLRCFLSRKRNIYLSDKNDKKTLQYTWMEFSTYIKYRQTPLKTWNERLI